MAYEYITKHNSPAFTPAAECRKVFGHDRKIESITIHWWGVDGQDFEGPISWFCRPDATTSAHYIVEAGRVACIVDPDDAAWHAGNARGNATSIGLELRPEARDGDYATAAELIRTLRDTYGDLPLIPHRDWKATQCPGRWDLARLDALARNTANTATHTGGTMPLTLSQIAAELDGWLDPILGTYVDEDNAYGPQCKDALSHYIRVVHNEPYTKGNGHIMAENMIAQRAWTPVDGIAQAQPGDIISLGTDPGHVVIALSRPDRTGRLRYADQNGGPLPAGKGPDEVMKIREGRLHNINGIARPPRYVGAVDDGAPIRHAVQRGDTLWGISRAYDVPLKQVTDLNPGIDPDNLRIGQTVTVSEGRTVTYMETTTEANVRLGPGHEHEVIGKLPAGTAWYATGTVERGWVQGRSPWMTKTGTGPFWVAGDLLTKGA